MRRKSEAVDFDFSYDDPGTPWEPDELLRAHEEWYDHAAFYEQNEDATPDA